jgi:integrase
VGLAGLLPHVLPHVFMHIEERGKSLIIRWRFEGKKYHKTLKNHNNPIGWKNAQIVKTSIEKDILSGHFNPTPYTQKGKITKQNIDITASELFDKYAANRLESRGLSHNSKVRFKSIASRLTQFLGDKPAGKVTPDIAANAIADWSEQASHRTLRSYLFSLAAAWNWAENEDLYTLGNSNPWNQSLDRLRKKLPPSKKPKPFTIEELRTIARGFRNHPKHSYYADAAIFISQTACRFGEMAALRWGSVGADCDVVNFVVAVSRGHLRDTTKTDESRTVQLTKTVKEVLRSRHQLTNPNPDDLVFPAPKGGYMNDNRFRGKIWKPVLESCGIDYKKPYNLRHTGTSQAYANGASLTEIAAQTGHSVKTLMSTYLHPTNEKCVFVDFWMDEEGYSE